MGLVKLRGLAPLFLPFTPEFAEQGFFFSLPARSHSDSVASSTSQHRGEALPL